MLECTGSVSKILKSKDMLPRTCPAPVALPVIFLIYIELFTKKRILMYT